jgi:hypothetical protein
MSHFTFTFVLALLLSAAMALLGNRSARERLHAAAYLLFCCGVATLAGGWVMFLIHG